MIMEETIMFEPSPASPTAARFNRALVDAGHVFESSIPGLKGRGAQFEAVASGLVGLIRGLRGDEVGVRDVQFPPIETQEVCERSDYITSFPNLVGSLRVFSGSDRDHIRLMGQVENGEDWTGTFVGSDLTLVPAACHPLYGALAGQTLDEPQRYGIGGWCFRHERSHETGRMISFRMQEEVYLGTADGAVAHRERYLELFADMLRSLGLAVDVEIANDPFFGRAGRMLKASQRSEALKFEVIADLAERPTAIASGNYHQAHFGTGFGIHLADGSPTHSSCAGVGLERATLALLWKHGLDVEEWPADVRALLKL